MCVEQHRVHSRSVGSKRCQDVHQVLASHFTGVDGPFKTRRDQRRRFGLTKRNQTLGLGLGVLAVGAVDGLHGFKLCIHTVDVVLLLAAWNLDKINTVERES